MSASNKKKLRKEQREAALTEKQLHEQRQAKQLKAYTLTFIIAMILVVAIVVGVLLTPYIEGGLRRATKAVTIADHELTAADLAYYYVDAISGYQDEIYAQYYSYYGNYWYYMLGFDSTLALNKQDKDAEKGQTWADYFVDEAIENAKSVLALYDDAMANDYKLSEEDQKELDDSLASLAEYVKKQTDYSSVAAYLRSIYGPSASEASYKSYYTITSIASAYYEDHLDSIEYEAKDYRAYEKDKLHLYNSYSYVYYTINMSSYLGEGHKDEDGKTFWTDDEKETARAQVTADMQALVAAGITDKASFDAAVQALKINKFDKDGNPVADDKKATAYEAKDINYNNMSLNTAAKDWVIEEERKAGDFEVFPIYDTASEKEEDESKKIINGYYVVLFNECDTNEVHLANVRHILSKFKGGTKDSNGNVTYSDAEKQTAKTEAEKLLKQFKDSIANETDAAKIEEKFAELANKESDDNNGKVTNGGIYEDIYPGQMVEPFEKWCFDADRKPGDTGLVETTYGWHIMFYSSTDEMTYRDSMIKTDMLNDDMTEWHEGLIEKTKATVHNLTFMDYDFVVG